MTDEQINLAIGAIMHAELVMDFPDVILDALNSVIAFLATMNEQPEHKEEPESETGTWIWKHYVWWCSECGKNPTKGMGYAQRAEELFDYCPHCGKKMEGVQM